MEALLEEMELVLTDLLQQGLAAAEPPDPDLAQRVRAAGMATGADLLGQIEAGLRDRQHQLEKSDSALVGAICRMSYYLELCRMRYPEEAIRSRWQEGERL